MADSAKDKVYGGIGRVLEAMTVGIATDVWGDIPYSQAVSNTISPTLDPQEQVYAAIQAKLDTAVDAARVEDRRGARTAPTCSTAVTRRSGSVSRIR